MVEGLRLNMNIAYEDAHNLAGEARGGQPSPHVRPCCPVARWRAPSGFFQAASEHRHG